LDPPDDRRSRKSCALQPAELVPEPDDFAVSFGVHGGVLPKRRNMNETGTNFKTPKVKTQGQSAFA
ncbi:hypothetical protein, partial [Enterococcus faecium]|uniref:hypothetical protein n=1 Tax=Enterococcus faecium TaxID=1352 RepID=UPI003F41CA22